MNFAPSCRDYGNALSYCDDEKFYFAASRQGNAIVSTNNSLKAFLGYCIYGS